MSEAAPKRARRLPSLLLMPLLLALGPPGMPAAAAGLPEEERAEGEVGGDISGKGRSECCLGGAAKVLSRRPLSGGNEG